MKKGFTIVELLVVMAVFGILVTVTFPVYNFFSKFRLLESSKQEIVQTMRLAQEKSKSGQGGNTYGLYFSTNEYTLYQGASYVGRNQIMDIVIQPSNEVEISGLTEVHFAAQTGLPSTAGTIVLTNTVDQTTEIITINIQGLIY